MSSFITVVYGARRFKVPVTPSTLLGQVRDEVCSGTNGLGLSSAEYGLSKQGKQLDLTVPLRFSNLVNNAQVDLVKVKASADAPIRVKIRVPNGKDYLGSFSGTTRVSDIIAAADLKGHTLALSGVHVGETTELRSLGKSTGGLLFTATEQTSAKQQTVPKPTPAGAPTHHPPSQQTSARSAAAPLTASPAGAGKTVGATQQASSAPAPPEREATISSDPQLHAGVESDDPPEMGVSQFNTYYRHLKTQAEPPLLSKDTRERMQKAKQAQIDTTIIRIRFPGNVFLEGKFQRGEHGEQVYQFVRSYLRAPTKPFELKSTNPAFTLRSEDHLIEDRHLGGRALLLFQWLGKPLSSSEPVLNDKAMALRSTPPHRPAPAGNTSDSTAKPVEPPIEAEDASNEKKRDTIKKVVPKWMRLHKK